MASTELNNRRPDIKITRPLLDKILLDGEFVSQRDLDAAVEKQQKADGNLGEILVGMGVLDPRELDMVLSIQEDLESLNDSVKLGAGVRTRLGELLIKAKEITHEQLDNALREQKQTDERLGELLLRHGLIKDSDLQATLAFQRHLGGNDSPRGKLRLGELLVATGQITRKQLEDAIDRQKLSAKPIGELLIEAGHAQPHQIDHGLKLQEKLVVAALVATLSLATVGGVEEAYAGTSAGGGSLGAKTAVTAQVLQRTSMRVISQAPALTVTDADVMRGYVEIPAATRVSVRTNNPAGYLLAFDVMSGNSPIFDSFQVLMGGREVQVSPNGGWIPQPYVRGDVMLDVGYRFALSKDAQPGVYNWPLTISVHPM